MGTIYPLHPKQNHFTILLIGTNVTAADSVKRQFEMALGASCHVWDCADDEEALDLLSVHNIIPLQNTEVDMIIMDLTSPGVDYPKERFVKAKGSFTDTPIVALTDRTDYDLAAFVMAEGAADTLSLWQIHTDPDRLRQVLAVCRACDNLRHAKQKSDAALEQGKIDNAAVIRITNEKNDAILSYVHERNSIVLKNLRNENEALRREIRQDEALIQNIKTRSYAVLRQVQEESDIDANDLNPKTPPPPRKPLWLSDA